MTQVVRNHVTDLRGVSRLAVDAIAATTGLVEAMHMSIAKAPARRAGAMLGGGAPRRPGRASRDSKWPVATSY